MSQFFSIDTKPNYLERKLMFDGQVSIQRFDENKYEKLVEFEKLARAMYWIPEEIDMSKDKVDMGHASEAIAHIFTSNLLRQTTLDSEQGKLPSVVLMPICSQPELEALLITWSFFEGTIHNRAYSHIIQGIFNVPKDQFDQIHSNELIKKMSVNIGKYYDALHKFNCMVELGMAVDVIEHKKAAWRALNASYALEAIRFLVSFATSLAMKERSIFMGNGNEIELIMQDELVHTNWSAYLLNILPKDDPDFAMIRDELREEILALYMEVVNEELDWADYLFIKGPVIGLNAKMLKSHVHYTARERLKEIGIAYPGEEVLTPALPFMYKYMNPEVIQKALQETENTNYLLGTMEGVLDLAALPPVVMR